MGGTIGPESDRCPECGDKWVRPDLTQCTCGVISIYIEPGKHIHIDCPKHGRVRIDGPSLTY
jgi:hypothetical protein